MKENCRIAVDGEIVQMQRRAATVYALARSYDIYWQSGDHTQDWIVEFTQERARILAVGARAAYETRG